MELIEQMKSALNCIPGENFWTLSCLMHHLKRSFNPSLFTSHSKDFIFKRNGFAVTLSRTLHDPLRTAILYPSNCFLEL